MRTTPWAWLAIAGLSTSCSFVKDFDDFSEQPLCASTPGMADCDHDGLSCETAIGVNDQNCGGCGVVCDGADFCADGPDGPECVHQEYAAARAFAVTGADASRTRPLLAPAKFGGVFVGLTHFQDATIDGAALPATNYEASVARVNVSGDVNWALTANGTNPSGVEYLYDVAATNDGVIAVGVTSSTTVTFSTVGTSAAPNTLANLAADGSYDGFVWAIGESGTHLYRIGFGGAGDTQIRLATSDGAGNVYVAGYFTSSDLRKTDNSGIQTVSLGGATTGLFVAKILPNGAVPWTTVVPASSPSTVLSHLAADPSGRVYVFASSSSSVTVEGTPMTPTSAQTPMILAFAANGDLDWFRMYTSAAPSAIGDIVTLADGRLFITLNPQSSMSSLGSIQLSDQNALAEIDKTNGDPIGVSLLGNDFFVGAMTRTARNEIAMVAYLSGDPMDGVLDFGGGGPPITHSAAPITVLVGYTAERRFAFAHPFGKTVGPVFYTDLVAAGGDLYLGGPLTEALLVDGISVPFSASAFNGYVARFHPQNVASP